MDDAERLAAIQERLGHAFTDTALLTQGLTHASRIDANVPAAQRVLTSNERMEYLGDAALGAAVARVLYETYPDAAEGLLSKAKSQLVSRAVLARCMERLELLDLCLVGDALGRPWPDSVKANLAEGLLGAIFLDGGWEAVRTAVERLLGNRLRLDHVDLDTDAKSRLQQLCLERFGALPEYRSERCGGSDHEPVFRCAVGIGDHEAVAEGGSRQGSEAAAANALLDLLDQHA